MRTIAILLALALPALAEEQTLTFKPGALTQVIRSQALNASVDNSYTVMLQGVGRGVLQVEVKPTGREFHPHVILENMDQEALFDEASSDRGVRFDHQHFVADGKYLLRVGDTGRGAFNQPYTLTLTYAPVPDAAEPNDDFAGAKELAFGKEATVTLFAAAESRDEDFFTVLLPAGRTEIVIGGQKDMQPVVTLYNMDMEEAWSEVAANPGANFRHVVTDLPAGRYYVKVAESGGRSSVKPLVMQFRTAP